MIMRAQGKRWLLTFLLLGATSALGFNTPPQLQYQIGIFGTAAAASFEPPMLTIVAGDSVLFYVNVAYDIERDIGPTTGPHNVVADDSSFRCALGCDGEGGDGTPDTAYWAFTRTFNVPGVVRYHDE